MQLYLGPELDNLALAVSWEYQNGQISEEITGVFILTGWRLLRVFFLKIYPVWHSAFVSKQSSGQSEKTHTMVVTS